MNSHSYFPNYFSVEDIFVTQEKISCQVNSRLLKMGFLDPSSGTEHLEQGKTVSLPLWYIKELKVNNPYVTVQIPEMYAKIHNAICQAECTQIDLGKLSPHFYEYGRYLEPYDRTHALGQIVSETCRQRIRYLLNISKKTIQEAKPEHKLDSLESKLYDAGIRTNTLFTNWLKQKAIEIKASELVQEHSKKRKRFTLDDDDMTKSSQPAKRYTS